MSTTSNQPPLDPAVLGRPTEQQHIPGEPGIWILILGDMTVFALLFGVYMDAFAGAVPAFHEAQDALNANYGVVDTLLLLCSSLLVIGAMRAMRAGLPTLAPRLIAGALLCAGGFAVSKGFEWSSHLSAGDTPASNDFWMYYFVLTGLHLGHLVVGCGVLAFMYRQARKPVLTARQLAFVEGGACFWHMVDLLWIVLFALLYLVR